MPKFKDISQQNRINEKNGEPLVLSDVKLNSHHPYVIRVGTLAKTKEAEADLKQQKVDKLPCGCIYEDKGWMLMRITECDYHHRKRTTKRPYRPKAECVRP